MAEPSENTDCEKNSLKNYSKSIHQIDLATFLGIPTTEDKNLTRSDVPIHQFIIEINDSIMGVGGLKNQRQIYKSREDLKIKRKKNW